MPYDGVTTYFVVEELREKLLHGKVNKIYQPESDEIILVINNKGDKYNLLLSANNNNPRAYITSATKENPQTPPVFCMLLRKNLQNAIVTGVKQSKLDRIIEVQFSARNELRDVVPLKLVVEIMGRHSNIILVNEDKNAIVDSVKRVGKNISSYREVLPGRPYVGPPQSKGDPREVDVEQFKYMIETHSKNRGVGKFILNSFMGVSPTLAYEICHRAKVDIELPLTDLTEKQVYNLYSTIDDLFNDLNKHKCLLMYTNENRSKIYDFSTVDYTYYDLYKKSPYESVSQLLEEFYHLRDNVNRIKNRAAGIVQMLNNRLDRDYNKLDKQTRELEKAESADKYKKYGELITSNIYSIKSGQDHALVTDYYTGSELSIPLSKQLSPAQNAQKYFKKYNKLKRAKEYLQEQIELTRREIYYLESQIDNLGKCTEIEEFNEIREELIENGYLKSQGRARRKADKTTSKPLKYVYNGTEILVGKNNKQNENLTLREAVKTDLWLHVKDIPGSHVIIKKNWEDVDDALLQKAALLAAYYSKGKNSSNVPVDYTPVKYVKKPKGAKTGMVIYTNQKTVYVTPAESEVLNIEREN